MSAQGEIAAAYKIMSTDRKRSKASRVPSTLSSAPSTIHRFRLTTIATVSSTAGGAIASVHTFDPTGFAEFSDISDLFSEIRIKAARITLTPVVGASGAGLPTIVRGVPVACNLGVTSTAPTSRTEVWSCAGAKVFQLNCVRPMVFEANIPQMSWALTSSPVPGPYAGCYGAFWIYSANLDNSSQYYDMFMECEYECRGRR